MSFKTMLANASLGVFVLMGTGYLLYHMGQSSNAGVRDFAQKVTKGYGE